MTNQYDRSASNARVLQRVTVTCKLLEGTQRSRLNRLLSVNTPDNAFISSTSFLAIYRVSFPRGKKTIRQISGPLNVRFPFQSAVGHCS